MRDETPEVIEAPLAKLEKLSRLRSELVRWDQAIAAAAPPRPRPWHTQARPNQLAPAGDWNILLILAGRGFGKMLALDTPIPTPGGWSAMGKLNIGDQVFDESGRVCRVTAVYDGWADDAYRLSFSDGSSLDACGDHQWVTWTHADRKAYLRSSYEDSTRMPADWPNWRARRQHWGHVEPRVHLDSAGPRVRTTRDIVDTLTYGKRGDRNHSIPVADSLRLPEADLSIDPYLLGVWLGDGGSRDGDITIGDADVAEMTTLIEVCGETVRLSASKPLSYTLGEHPRRRDPKTGRMVPNGGFRSRLRALGVLGNKHVPDAYLRSSAAQRLALLQGLMDTDGYAAPSSHVEFCSTDRNLADAVVELACSLGQKPVLAEGRATLNGRDCGPKYRITWRPTIDVFRLARKLARIRKPSSQAFRNYHRMITSADRIPAQPMRCITVDAPNAMYLAGEHMVPTHNTRCGAEWLAEQAATHPNTEWAIVAPTWRDCRKVCIEGPSGLLKSFLPGELESLNASDLTVRLANGSRIYGYSADGYERLRGSNLAGAWVDEMAVFGNPADLFGEALMPALRIGDNPRVLITTTPRPIRFLRDLVDRDDGSVFVVRGSTWDNAKNLSTTAVTELKARYEGTRTGRQELEGELLVDIEGALWSRDQLDTTRIPKAPEMARIVVGVDPAVTSGERSDFTGIVVAGRSTDGHLYILEDLTMKGSPHTCMTKAASAFHRWHADRIVAEVNNGGDYLEGVLRTVDTNVPYSTVRATRGKIVRAEPIAALWEQGRGHVVGCLPVLEDQMCSFTSDTKESPDNFDAMIWAATELNVGASALMYLNSISTMCLMCNLPSRKTAVACVHCGAALRSEVVV